MLALAAPTRDDACRQVISKHCGLVCHLKTATCERHKHPPANADTFLRHCCCCEHKHGLHAQRGGAFPAFAAGVLSFWRLGGCHSVVRSWSCRMCSARWRSSSSSSTLRYIGHGIRCQSGPSKAFFCCLCCVCTTPYHLYHGMQKHSLASTVVF